MAPAEQDGREHHPPRLPSTADGTATESAALATAKVAEPACVAVETLTVKVLNGRDAGRRVDASEEILTIGTAAGNGLVLHDETVSGHHVELAAGPHGVLVTDLGSTNGTFFGQARIAQASIPAGAVLTLGRSQVRVQRGAGAMVALHAGKSVAGLVGTSEPMRRVMAQISRIAAACAPALLVGESGTGKELAAAAIHRASARAAGPFATVDCGAISPTLIASELFGHERGAFTGADRTFVGAFERAHGGTLFLDEVGEMPLSLQPLLLGALERRRFRRLGGRKDIEVDVAVVAATNRDLRAEVNLRRFRLDLYYRLAVATLRMPPLRAHVEDLPLLIESFLRKLDHDGQVEDIAPPEVMQMLQHHRWPGNVRELRNWVECTVALGEATEPHTADLLADTDIAEDLLTLPYKEARGLVLGWFESRYLAQLYQRAGQNTSEAARLADVDRTYLIKLLRRHGLK